MLNSAIHDDNNPQRQAKTCSLSHRKRITVPSRKPMGREQLFGQEDTFRPCTSQLGSPRGHQTLNTTGKSINLVNMRTIDVVEDELKSQFKQQMCGYLRNKLRHLVGKRQEDVLYSRYLNSTIQNASFENTSNSSFGPLDQFYLTFNQKSRLRKEKGVEGAYVSNAKEHILRMIYRKRQEVDDREELSNSIKTRRKERHQRKSRSLKDHFKCPAVERESWDKEWKESLSKQKKRYRHRLVLKFDRQNTNKKWLMNFSQ